MEQKFEIFKIFHTERAKKIKSLIQRPTSSDTKWTLMMKLQREITQFVQTYTKRACKQKTFITTKNTTNVAHFPKQDPQAFRQTIDQVGRDHYNIL